MEPRTARIVRVTSVLLAGAVGALSMALPLGFVASDARDANAHLVMELDDTEAQIVAMKSVIDDQAKRLDDQTVELTDLYTEAAHLNLEVKSWVERATQAEQALAQEQAHPKTVTKEVKVEVPVEKIVEVPADTLQCGRDAKPAIDQTPEGEWWAYCEPALID